MIPRCMLLKDPIHRGMVRLVLSQESEDFGHVLLTEPGATVATRATVVFGVV